MQNKSGAEKSITQRGSYFSAPDFSASGAQTERRGDAGPMRLLLGRKTRPPISFQ
jgi:hypothetical protein